MSSCPKFLECANADIKCHICIRFNCFKTGRSRGKGQASEKQVLKARNKKNAQLRAGSGSAAHAKGDILDELALHEVKSGYQRSSKGSKSFTIQREWLLKIEREALIEGKLPLLDFHFDQAPQEELWTVLRSAVLFDLLDELARLQNLQRKE